MGGACSRKRDHLVEEDGPWRAASGRYSKSSSSKWLLLSLPRCASNVSQNGLEKCPSLMELCIAKIQEDIDHYSTFSLLPKDISQQIFDELVKSHCLSESTLEAFRDCALEDIHLGEYPGVKDTWMGVISSQGQSLLSLDISFSDVTDSGLVLLRGCSNLRSLRFNYCDQISELGLENISGLSNLTSLSFKKSTAINGEGMKAFTNLVNLINLDLERCIGIQGGLTHLKGLSKLEKLNIRYCNCIRDADMKPLSGLTNLKELQMSSCKVTDAGIAHIKDLSKLSLLNLEGCPVTAACLEYISGFALLLYLILGRCNISDDGCQKFAGLKRLKILNLGFNRITDACLVHLKDLINLKSLNLDSCKICDEGLSNLIDPLHLKILELSDTKVGSHGLRHLSGLCNLESITLSFTSVSNSGVFESPSITSMVKNGNAELTPYALELGISEGGISGVGYIWAACETGLEEGWRHSIAPIPAENLKNKGGQVSPDTAGFEALENEGMDMEIDLSNLGTVKKVFAALFSKLGVPIKTTISATVLEEALSGTVTVSPLPLGSSLSGKVEKQNAHFLGVTINDEQAQAGIIVRDTSTAQSKFKLLYFEQEANGGYGLALQEDSEKTGKITSAGMYFLHFQVYRMDSTVSALAMAKDPDNAFFKRLDGLQPCEVSELNPSTHIFAVYGECLIAEMVEHSLVPDALICADLVGAYCKKRKHSDESEGSKKKKLKNSTKKLNIAHDDYEGTSEEENVGKFLSMSLGQAHF